MDQHPEFSRFKDLTLTKAYEARQIGTLSHLLIDSLWQHPRHQLAPIQTAVARIQAEVLTYTSRTTDERLVSFDPAAAVVEFDTWWVQQPSRYSLPVEISLWLLTGNFIDGTLSKSRTTCFESGVTAAYLKSTDSGGAHSDLGFGQLLNDDWFHANQEPVLLAREADLEKHFSHLQLALTSNRHFLLEGHPGVGKTLFVRELLRLAHSRWINSTDARLRAMKFVFLTPADFLASQEENRIRLENLYKYLQLHPDVTAVFDGLEYLLTPSLSTHEHFTAQFGSWLSGGGRSLVLVCQTSPAGRTELLRQVKGLPLPALGPQATCAILMSRLEWLRRRAKLVLQSDPNDAELSQKVVSLASERYPGRFFPEVAVHLLESAAQRAQTRIVHHQKPPLDRVTVRDAWEHAAEEQGLQAEVFGKDPKEFYEELRLRLRDDVRGQDHAIDLVCDSLVIQSELPPQRTPRGRFLFAGPSGVGKTELARSLAIRMGLGEEAFFIFNMAEFGSDSARTRFLGADPGYVGFRNTRTIFDMVRSRPSCIILLDEIDRSDPSIQDLLLGMLEGQGKDSQGDPVYFSQAIFVMTTNQQKEAVNAAYGAGMEAGHSRERIATTLGNEQLRRLFLDGVSDASEIRMRDSLQKEMDNLKKEFDQLKEGDPIPLKAIELFSDLRRLDATLLTAHRRSALDRAFLDRIDFIVPFFPIRELPLLADLFDQKAMKTGLTNVQPEWRDSVILRAAKEDQSVRFIIRSQLEYRVQRLRRGAS